MTDASLAVGKTPHLNVHGLEIRETVGAGRGVFATRVIEPQTILEISPVLLFDADEYQTHGRHTLLDSYTFVWDKRSDGSTMALALGLGVCCAATGAADSPGSLFNHHPTAPNVSYELDKPTQSIRYRAVRTIYPQEELCISYGSGRMWWEEPRPASPQIPATAADECALFGGMNLDEDREEDVPSQPALTRPPDIPASYNAPLWRMTGAPDPNIMPLTTKLAWAVNVPARSSKPVISAHQSLLKQGRLRGNDAASSRFSIRHLRSFRKAHVVRRAGSDTPASDDPGVLSMLVAMCDAYPDHDELRHILLEAFGDNLPNLDMYPVRVPAFAAPSRARLAEWAAVWPCVFLPPGAGFANPNGIPGSDAARASTPVDRAADAGMWQKPQPDGSLAEERVLLALRRCLQNARLARAAGEQVGVGVFVTSELFADGRDAQWTSAPIEVDAYDTRTSERHPLRHAVLNAVRKVAEIRAQRRLASGVEAPAVASAGQDYLLTGMTLFITHEPCVYCAMALIHSRVRAVYFLCPSPGSGGFCGAHSGEGGSPACLGGEDGGPYAIHEQSGLNHRYDVWRWVAPEALVDDLHMLETRIELDV